MDQVFDALNAESPYDRCSIEINSSIMLYKDGKDKGLIGGTSDINDKDSTINRFYERLKSDISKNHGSDDDFEIENIGTQVGRYMFNNRNDFVERASEAFDESIEKVVSWENILKIIHNHIVFDTRQPQRIYFDGGLRSQTINAPITVVRGVEKDPASPYPRRKSTKNGWAGFSFFIFVY